MTQCGYKLHNLYIYLTEECNLACKHCWQSAKYTKTVTAPQVPIEVYLRFIDQAIPLGLAYVKISGGEPLLRKADLIALIEYLGKAGLQSRLETNGTLIDDEVADAIAAAGTGVSVSLDGGSAPVHERVRSVRGCFDATLEALDRLRKCQISVELILSLYRENAEDLPALAAMASTFRRGSLKINPILQSGRGSKMMQRGELLTIQELQEFVRRVEREYYGSRPPVLVSTPPAFHSLSFLCTGQVNGGHCGFKSLMGILANGSVSFCGLGYRAPQYVFMRAEETSLADVWNHHPVLSEMRAKIPSQLEGVCGNCIMKNSCQGACRAEAYEHYGSITAPCPGCQQLYDTGLFPTSRLVAPTRDCRYTASEEAPDNAEVAVAVHGR